MERSIGFERTIKPRDFESLKVTSFIGGVPLEQWSDGNYMDFLYKLMIVQSYKAIFSEENLLKTLRSEEDKMAYLLFMEKELSEVLDLDGLIIKTNVEKE